MTFPPTELLVERVFNSSFFIPTARFKYLLAGRSIMVEEVGVEPTMRWKWSMPGAGIEPALPEGKEILSLMCLPIPPSGHTLHTQGNRTPPPFCVRNNVTYHQPK